MRREKHYSDKNNGCSGILWTALAVIVAFIVAFICGADVFDEVRNP